MSRATRDHSSTTGDVRTPVVLFGVGMAALVLYVLLFPINLPRANDFYREALPSYRLLAHGHPLAFIRVGPLYVGSLILRAPFAMAAWLLGAGGRGIYIATALPCIVSPALLAGWLAHERAPATPRPGSRRLGAARGSRGDGPPRGRAQIRPLDLFMLTPPAIVCLHGGHPEEILGAVLCVAAVLLAQRGDTRASGLALGLALINKPWAIIVVPLVFALMPPDRRLRGIVTAALVTALVMVPVLAIRMGGPQAGAAGLGSGTEGMLLVPEMLWFFGRGSWVVREGHVILVLAGWLATAAWWWLRIHKGTRRPDVHTTLMVLALIFFLRAVLDPWDNLYYFTPFMLTLMVSEDARGFPRLSWCFAVLLVVMVPPESLLRGLGANGHAAAFAAFSLLTIGWFSRRAFATTRRARAAAYATAVSSAPAAPVAPAA